MTAFQKLLPQEHTPMDDATAQKYVAGYRASMLAHCCCRQHAARMAQMVMASFVLDYCEDDLLQMGRLLDKRKEKFNGKIGCTKQHVEKPSQ